MVEMINTDLQEYGFEFNEDDLMTPLTTKERVEELISDVAPDQVEAFRAISDEGWRHYLELLRLYFSGASTDSGWHWLIEHSLRDVDVPKRLAFVLARIHGDLETEDEG